MKGSERADTALKKLTTGIWNSRGEASWGCNEDGFCSALSGIVDGLRSKLIKATCVEEVVAVQKEIEEMR